MITFEAEVIEVKAKKVVSGDKEFRITLVTDDKSAINLEEAIATYPVKISIEESK